MSATETRALHHKPPNWRRSSGPVPIVKDTDSEKGAATNVLKLLLVRFGY
ncbi:hypothetical protein QQ020_33090 [Fulvivirgaceae bacterium BMA12]|uniref:Uncharacterized protein n=1 Tax=Agaribacillus aureus TaxID=3051825 RepID=A0ABT8LGN1_9BACT|nr:hypothetical protein [Fulvivirgaceae bacterium BMA12]